MERTQRLAAFWNWLPAFRVVAETGHLPTASRYLHVSPSALSRSVHLLENRLGLPLFNRQGRSIAVNEVGERFLAAVRDAMRLLDDGLARVASRQQAGPVHLAAAAFLSEAALPSLMQLQLDHPELVIYLHEPHIGDATARLLQGLLDVLLLPEPLWHDRLHTEVVGAATNGIYCGRGHPLFRARRIDLERVLGHPFVAPIPGETGFRADNWPAELPRRVRMYINQFPAAAEVCARGHLLCVLPDRVVASHPHRRAFRRLPLDVIPPTRFYALRRPSLAGGGLAELVVASLKHHLKDQRRSPGPRPAGRRDHADTGPP